MCPGALISQSTGRTPDFLSATTQGAGIQAAALLEIQHGKVLARSVIKPLGNEDRLGSRPGRPSLADHIRSVLGLAEQY